MHELIKGGGIRQKSSAGKLTWRTALETTVSGRTVRIKVPQICTPYKREPLPNTEQATIMEWISPEPFIILLVKAII